MSRRRYVYTYSPRRYYQQQNATNHLGRRLLLGLALTGAVVLAGVWLIGDGGGSPSPSSTGRDSAAQNWWHLRLPDGQSHGELADHAADNPLQGGGGDALSYAGDVAPPLITALAAAVIEEPCGVAQYRLNGGLRLPPASLTKIVTALVAVDHADLSEMVTVHVSGGELSAASDATVMGIEPGERYSVRDLLYGMLLPSGNDAAIALAEHVSGSEAAFVKLMNAMVGQLGLDDTHFTNPHGLDDPALYTSAYDIAMLGRELLHEPALAEIVRTRSYQPDWQGGPLKNHNLLLSQYPGALGVKTGYTDTAGQTLVAAAERGGRRIIVSVLGSSNVYVDAISLLDWAFESAPRGCGTLDGPVALER